MNLLTPADAATLGLTETELAHLCDQYQAAEFYPLEGYYVEPDADEIAAARAAGFPDAPTTQAARTEAAARAVLEAAGFRESPPVDGWAESARHWPFGFMLDEAPGNPDALYIYHWDQVYYRDTTPESRGAHLAELGRYADALRAAGWTVTLHTAPGERPWLHAEY